MTKRKSGKRALKRKCDKLFSQIVRVRGGCEETGGTEALQCCHIISRSYHATRWDLDNAFCLTQKRHMYYTNHPLEWANFVTHKIGQEKYEALKKKALDYKKMKTGDYQQLYAKLKEKYEALSN